MRDRVHVFTFFVDQVDVILLELQHHMLQSCRRCEDGLSDDSDQRLAVGLYGDRLPVDVIIDEHREHANTTARSSFSIWA